MAKKTLKELKALLRKINDNADRAILEINDAIEGLKTQKDEIEYARASLITKIHREIEEATIKEYEKILIK